MSKKNITEIVGIIVAELTPLTSEERQRAVQASMTLLGENAWRVENRSAGVEETDGGSVGQLPVRVRTWVRQNGLSMEQVQQVFHFDNGAVEIIASEIPGRINKERVRNAYVLMGVRHLLLSGEPKFDDQAARALCDAHGVYDHTNHSKYLKGGNELTGSRDKGWTLTMPGLKRGAELVKELADES